VGNSRENDIYKVNLRARSQLEPVRQHPFTPCTSVCKRLLVFACAESPHEPPKLQPTWSRSLGRAVNLPVKCIFGKDGLERLPAHRRATMSRRLSCPWPSRRARRERRTGTWWDWAWLRGQCGPSSLPKVLTHEGSSPPAASGSLGASAFRVVSTESCGPDPVCVSRVPANLEIQLGTDVKIQSATSACRYICKRQHRHRRALPICPVQSAKHSSQPSGR